MQLSWMAALALVVPSETDAHELLSQLACTACHAPPSETDDRWAPLPAPELSAIGARMTPRSLRRYLQRPHGERPGSAMPDLLGQLPDEEREATIEALTHWLVSQGGPLVAESQDVSPTRVERGRQLYHTVGCVACHAPSEPAADLEYGFWEFEGEASEADFADQNEAVHDIGDDRAPALAVPLPGLAQRTSAAALAAFLRDPAKVRPSGRMPSLSLSETEALDIAYYLLREQALGDQAGIELKAGLRYALHEGKFSTADPDGPAFADPPTREGVVSELELPEHPEDRYAFRFDGFLRIERTGNYRFETTSDDGSFLYIDGDSVVDNDGHHGPISQEGQIWLEEGLHALLVTFFEGSGGDSLKVRWSGPDFDDQPLPAEGLFHSSLEYSLRTRPFEVDDKLAARGRAHFEALGCATCHEGAAPAMGPPALADLDPTRGCLSADSGVDYALDEGQRGMLASLVSNARSLAMESPEQRVQRHMHRFACTACHERDGSGGVHPARSLYFRADEEQDLGDEGRLPPHLTGVGAKLREEWLQAVLSDPNARVRPYLKARMPHFDTPHVADLAASLASLDATAGMDEEPPYSETAVENGRRLVGTKGLGCIQCHTFNGYESLGIPAVDLGEVHARIRPGWFHTLLTDPEAVGMNSRMPVFWDSQGRSPVLDVLGGDPAAQADAVRTYLSLGAAMPLPEGLVADDARYELEPAESPILTAVFLENVGPRVLLVGTPERVHYAFDMENSTLTHTWRGRFFNAKGTWHGRAGKLEEIPDGARLSLPLDAPLALLEEASASWPKSRGRASGIRSLGRKHDEQGLPIFRYGWSSPSMPAELVVEDRMRPQPGGVLQRQLHWSGAQPPAGSAFLLARSENIALSSAGAWVFDGARVELASSDNVTARVRESARGSELILEFTNLASESWHASAELLYRWP